MRVLLDRPAVCDQDQRQGAEQVPRVSGAGCFDGEVVQVVAGGAVDGVVDFFGGEAVFSVHHFAVEVASCDDSGAAGEVG